METTFNRKIKSECRKNFEKYFPKTTDVVIVGVTTGGLILSLDLINKNVKNIIINNYGNNLYYDKINEQYLLHPKTLEILQDLNLLSEVSARGLKLNGISFYVENKLVNTTDKKFFQKCNAAFPYMLSISKYVLNNILKQQLQSAGKVIEENTFLWNIIDKPETTKKKEQKGEKQNNTSEKDQMILQNKKYTPHCIPFPNLISSNNISFNPFAKHDKSAVSPKNTFKEHGTLNKMYTKPSLLKDREIKDKKEHNDNSLNDDVSSSQNGKKKETLNYSYSTSSSMTDQTISSNTSETIYSMSKNTSDDSSVNSFSSLCSSQYHVNNFLHSSDHLSKREIEQDVIYHYEEESFDNILKEFEKTHNKTIKNKAQSDTYTCKHKNDNNLATMTLNSFPNVADHFDETEKKKYTNFAESLHCSDTNVSSYINKDYQSKNKNDIRNNDINDDCYYTIVNVKEKTRSSNNKEMEKSAMIKAKFVVGIEGRKSLVRKCAQINLKENENSCYEYISVDICIKWKHEMNHYNISLISSEQGFITCFPIFFEIGNIDENDFFCKNKELRENIKRMKREYILKQKEACSKNLKKKNDTGYFDIYSEKDTINFASCENEDIKQSNNSFETFENVVNETSSPRNNKQEMTQVLSKDISSYDEKKNAQLLKDCTDTSIYSKVKQKNIQSITEENKKDIQEIQNESYVTLRKKYSESPNNSQIYKKIVLNLDTKNSNDICKTILMNKEKEILTETQEKEWKEKEPLENNSEEQKKEKIETNKPYFQNNKNERNECSDKYKNEIHENKKNNFILNSATKKTEDLKKNKNSFINTNAKIPKNSVIQCIYSKKSVNNNIVDVINNSMSADAPFRQYSEKSSSSCNENSVYMKSASNDSSNLMNASFVDAFSNNSAEMINEDYLTAGKKNSYNWHLTICRKLKGETKATKKYAEEDCNLDSFEKNEKCKIKNEYKYLLVIKLIKSIFPGSEIFYLYNLNINMHRDKICKNFFKKYMILAGEANCFYNPIFHLSTNLEIQDVYNIGWKLKYMIQHNASLLLLETYEKERKYISENITHWTEKKLQLLFNSSFSNSFLNCCASTFLNVSNFSNFFKNFYIKVFMLQNENYNNTSYDFTAFINKKVFCTLSNNNVNNMRKPVICRSRARNCILKFMYSNNNYEEKTISLYDFLRDKNSTHTLILCINTSNLKSRSNNNEAVNKNKVKNNNSNSIFSNVLTNNNSFSLKEKQIYDTYDKKSFDRLIKIGRLSHKIMNKNKAHGNTLKIIWIICDNERKELNSENINPFRSQLPPFSSNFNINYNKIPDTLLKEIKKSRTLNQIILYDFINDFQKQFCIQLSSPHNFFQQQNLKSSAYVFVRPDLAISHMNYVDDELQITQFLDHLYRLYT